MKCAFFTSVVALAGLASPSFVRADFVIDFDSLPATGLQSGLSGSAVTNYFANFGITVSGVTAGTAVTVYDARVIYADVQPVIPTSPFNVITQVGSNDPVSYTLNFALPQDRFGMTRTAIRSGSTGVALPEWRAFAYDASGNLLGSVGENAVSVFSDISPKAFTLNGPNIRSVRIASDNHNFAAFSAVILDNFTVTAVPSVPEPQSLVLASIGCVMLLGNQVRKRWASSRSALSTYP